jgi:MFS family permease
LLLHLIALSCFRRIRPTSSAPRVSTSSMAGHWAVTLRVLRRSRNLRLALAITVAMNSFVYGYISLVPLLVGRFDSSALVVSLLAAGDGLGQVCAGLVLMTLGIRRPGVVLAAGAIITSSSILVFSQASAPGPAFVALVFAGVGTSGLAATQTVAALKDAEADERGAVLGLVSTAIGAMPVGMLLIGSLAAVVPAESALALTAGIGLAVVLAVALRGRATLRAD